MIHHGNDSIIRRLEFRMLMPLVNGDTANGIPKLIPTKLMSVAKGERRRRCAQRVTPRHRTFQMPQRGISHTRAMNAALRCIYFIIFSKFRIKSIIKCTLSLSRLHAGDERRMFSPELRIISIPATIAQWATSFCGVLYIHSTSMLYAIIPESFTIAFASSCGLLQRDLLADGVGVAAELHMMIVIFQSPHQTNRTKA